MVVSETYTVAIWPCVFFKQYVLHGLSCWFIDSIDISMIPIIFYILCSILGTLKSWSVSICWFIVGFFSNFGLTFWSYCLSSCNVWGWGWYSTFTLSWWSYCISLWVFKYTDNQGPLNMMWSSLKVIYLYSGSLIPLILCDTTVGNGGSYLCSIIFCCLLNVIVLWSDLNWFSNQYSPWGIYLCFEFILSGSSVFLTRFPCFVPRVLFPWIILLGWHWFSS